MGTGLFLPLLLQLAGIVVIIAEVILPSGGVLTLLALGLFGCSLWMVFTEVSATAGMVLLAADAVTVPVLVIVGIKLLARSPVTLRKVLSRDDGVSSQAPELAAYRGVEGVALTDLRPAGVARLGDRRVDVVTEGDYISKNTPVVVCNVTGNQVVVRKRESG